MRKVAHLIRPAAGGMRRHFILLLKELSRIYQIIAYVPEDEFLSRELKKNNLTFETVPFPPHGTIWDYYRLSSYLVEKWRAEEFSLFHFHGYRAAFVGSLAIRKIKKGKAIATIHNLPPPGFFNRLFFLAVRKVIISNCQHLIFVSRAVKEAWKLKKDSVNSSVIYNGVSEDFFDTEASINSDYSGKKEDVKVAFIGRLSREKGADVFIKAASLLKDEKSLKFLVVGEGEEKNFLVDLSFSLGLGKKVEFLDFEPDLQALLKSIDLVVIPSRQEAFSLLAVEALALGKPVIASKVGGLPEALGKFGYFFPAGNYKVLAQRIREVTDVLFTFPSKEAREWVQKKFPLSKMVKQVEQLYQEVIGVGT